MEILVAAQAGFCFGVERALKMAREALALGGEVYSWGALIHNDQVVRALEGEGMRVTQRPEELPPGSRVVIRTHGAVPEVYQHLQARGLEVVDATCPFVRRAQRYARRLAEEGYRVVIVGRRDHPEVSGLLGWSGGDALVVEDAAEAAQLPFLGRVGVVVQTTQTEANLRAVMAQLVAKAGDLVLHNTICQATKQRQEAAESLAREVEAMVVVGGRQSANTSKLAEVCRQQGVPTYLIEGAAELQGRWFQDKERVGITAGASTPDWLIEEVVLKMSGFGQGDQDQEQREQEMVTTEETVEHQDGAVATAEEQETGPLDQEPAVPAADEQQEVEAQLEQGLRQLRRGDIVDGTVVQVGENEVLVDVGSKSEAIIPLQELSSRTLADPRTLVQVGDQIKVYVLRPENEEGRPVVSKKRADRELAWGTLEDSLENGTEIGAEVVEVVKGGLLVDVGVRGFVPASLVERGYVENLDAYLGKTLRLRVIELDRSRNKAVLSQKAILDEEYRGKREQTWATLEEGQVVHGVVRRLTNFGAFVDIGGVDGLLHVSEISWGRVEHPADVLSEGQEIEVKVLALDRAEGKVSLGRKQILANPWSTAVERYPVGAVVEGKVLRLASFGAFIEVEPGIEGLVHISQLADYHVAKTEDVVSVGERVKVKVLSVDEAAQRMSLSIKAAYEDGGGGGRRQQQESGAEPASAPEEQRSGVKLGDLFGELFENREE